MIIHAITSFLRMFFVALEMDVVTRKLMSMQKYGYIFFYVSMHVILETLKNSLLASCVQ